MIEGLLDQLKNKKLTLEDRYSAIIALIRFYSNISYNCFKEILEDDNEPIEIRSAAALALGKLGEKSIDELKKQINNENPIIRNYVVQALGMIGEKAIPGLLSALKDNNNEVFYSAADAIGAMGVSAVPYLKLILAEGEQEVKCVAAWKLGVIKDISAIPDLINTLKDNNNNDDVMALSTWALGEISLKNKNNKSIISALFKASKRGNPKIKQRAIVALSKAREYLN